MWSWVITDNWSMCYQLISAHDRTGSWGCEGVQRLSAGRGDPSGVDSALSGYRESDRGVPMQSFEWLSDLITDKWSCVFRVSNE